MAMPLNFVIVRHGQSEGNVATAEVKQGEGALMERIAAVHTEAWRLSPTGRTQPGPTGEWLKREFPGGFSRYLVSSYARAMETSALLSLPGAEWMIHPMLVERNWGSVSSLTPEERASGQAAADFDRRDRDGIWWAPSGGESVAAILPRLHQVLNALHREQSDGHVIAVCHGEVMWAMRVLLERLTPQQFRELDESRDPHDRIHNCQVLHYTRLDPFSGEISRRLDWVRSVCPWDMRRSSNEWRRIERPRFTNEQLLALVEGYPRYME